MGSVTIFRGSTKPVEVIQYLGDDNLIQKKKSNILDEEYTSIKAPPSWRAHSSKKLFPFKLSYNLIIVEVAISSYTVTGVIKVIDVSFIIKMLTLYHIPFFFYQMQNHLLS